MRIIGDNYTLYIKYPIFTNILNNSIRYYNNFRLKTLNMR